MSASQRSGSAEGRDRVTASDLVGLIVAVTLALALSLALDAAVRSLSGGGRDGGSADAITKEIEP